MKKKPLIFQILNWKKKTLFNTILLYLNGFIWIKNRIFLQEINRLLEKATEISFCFQFCLKSKIENFSNEIRNWKLISIFNLWKLIARNEKKSWRSRVRLSCPFGYTSRVIVTVPRGPLLPSGAPDLRVEEGGRERTLIAKGLLFKLLWPGR